jgi:NAD(P)-dependent dehydrogenase (short-subunit alcohol dehydrogenase family)
MARTVFITGCSSGIGRVTAQYFAAQGWNVAATSRNPASIWDWAKDERILGLPLDVNDESSIASAVAAALGRFGTIDVLVNNAGFGLFGPIEGATAEQFESQFRTNVFGTVAVIRHVLPSMRQKRSGTIINMSSIAGRFGSAFLAPYTASKYAIEGLTESLRFELEAHRIRVKLVEPGHFKSDFITRSLQWCTHPAYEPQQSNMFGWIRGSVARAKDPVIVAKTVFRAANDSSGRLRYPVGGGALRFFHAILPDAVWRRMLGAGMNRAPRSNGGVPQNQTAR